MMGCYPLPLKPFIDNGDIEYADWAMIYDYPRAMHNLNLNAVFAPLMDCTFNKANPSDNPNNVIKIQVTAVVTISAFANGKICRTNAIIFKIFKFL
jgi:hypothetical protein